MGLFRFPHSWAALAGRARSLDPIAADLDDRDRALEDYLAAETTRFDSAQGPGWSTGSAPEGGFDVRAGRPAVGTDASGVCGVTFSTPFKSGQLACLATIAHTGNNILLSQTAGDANGATFTAKHANSDLPVVSSLFFIQYIAVGW